MLKDVGIMSYIVYSFSVCNCDCLLESGLNYQLMDLANACRHLGIDSALVLVCGDL